MGEPRHLKRQVPTWLVGLAIAIVVFGVVILVANLVGYGDDPSIGALGGIIAGS
ncbi:MAG TPA: hypothetical protein VIW94_10380 [Acidimicrobiia bacterium]